MRRCLLFILLMLSSPGFAQVYSRQSADSLLGTLNGSLCDSCRVNNLITVSDFILHQRHISKLQFDSVNYQIAEVKKINTTLRKESVDERLVVLQALYYKATGHRQAGMQLLAGLINKLHRENNQLLLGRVYYEYSDFFNGDLLQPTMNTRIYYLKKSIAAYNKTQDRLSLGRDYRFLADLHMMTDSMGAAFVEANTALSLYHAVGYKDIQGILALLGRMYFSQQNYKQAVNYELMALNAAKKSKQDNVRLICQIDNTLGIIFSKLNDFPNSLYYYNQSLDIAKQEKDNGTIYLLAANLADTYIKAGRGQEAITFFRQINDSFPIPKKQIYEDRDFGVSKTFLKIYIALNMFDKAKPYYARVLIQANNPNVNSYNLAEYYGLIARANIGVKNYPLAQLYLDKNEKLLSSIKDYSDLSTNYRLKAALDTTQGHYHTGIQHILMAQNIEDSLFNVVKSQQIGELQVAYLTREKEGEISFFEQKANIEKANLQKANLIRDFSLAGVAALLFIAVLLYRQNRQKKQHNNTIVKSNQKLGSLVAEKEWLLKEVHHRVKNNLHTVLCLLESQASFLTDEALYAVESSRSRIYAMSLIHQKFYQSDNVSSIEMKSYISELVQYLGESFGYPAGIVTHIDVPEVKLNISSAIPVGLIINEAVNNAYKYAFPGKRMGEISISLKMIGAEVVLTISDNGVGIPFDPALPIADSLGIELIKGLATDLKGTIKFMRGPGTSILISFKYNDVADDANGVFYA